MTKPIRVAGSWTLRLLAAAVLLGGLRDPRLAALGTAAAFALVWQERPAIGPAAPWLPWLAWGFLAACAGAQPLAAAPSLARWFAALAFFSLAARWEERERAAWVKTLLGCCAILAPAALWTGAGRGFRGEMTGLIPPYYNYTTFVLSAGAAAGAVWALSARSAGRRSRAAALAVAALCAACLFLAHGRGAQLGVLAAAIVWAGRRWGMKAGAAALLAAGLAAAAFGTGLVPASVRADLLRHGGRYEGARPDIWRGAAAIADENPWLGAGPGSFGAAFRRHPAEARGGAARWGLNTDFAHSEPLQAAAETGWAGLALWLAALGASFSFFFRRAHREPAREAAAIAAVAMAVHLLVDNMLQLPGLAFLFFSALAVAGAGTEGGPRWPRTAAAAGLILALGAGIPRALAAGDPARAAALFPREAEPREDLAYRAMSAGQADRADALWNEAEARAPYDAVYPWRRAQIAAARGRWADAERFSARAAFLEPFFLNDRVLRAEALARLGRGSDARAQLADVLRILRERGDRPATRGYEATIWDFDRKEYERVAGLIGAARR